MNVFHDRRCFVSRAALALAAGAGLVGLTAGADAAEEGPAVVRVLSFNLWHGGDGGGKPLDQSVEVVKRSGADVVGFQETTGFGPEGKPKPDNSAEIAERLGWNHFDQGGSTAVASRFEIVGATPKKWGVKLKLPSGGHMYAFNAHFMYTPYQPYQILKIPYGDAPFVATEAEAVRAAEETRGGQVAEMLSELRAVVAAGFPVVVTGDFNEPSHQDWTEAAAQAKLHPIKVEWPTTKAVTDAGLVDSYRTAHPDPVVTPGLTWTPTTTADDSKDHHDRIDFVFVGGLENPAAAVKSARIVGESAERADVVVAPYPSDHRAVVAELELPAGAGK